MVRKIKILVTLFVVMLVLSTDLGSFFSKQPASSQEVQVQEAGNENEEFFQFAHLRHNIGCITDAIKSMITNKTTAVIHDVSNQYSNALADTTTQAVEKAILEKGEANK